jgi:predicted nucleic acid-binding protein
MLAATAAATATRVATFDNDFKKFSDVTVDVDTTDA